MGKSRDARKNVKKKAQSTMKEKKQAKRDKRNLGQQPFGTL